MSSDFLTPLPRSPRLPRSLPRVWLPSRPNLPDPVSGYALSRWCSSFGLPAAGLHRSPPGFRSLRADLAIQLCRCIPAPPFPAGTRQHVFRVRTFHHRWNQLLLNTENLPSASRRRQSGNRRLPGNQCVGALDSLASRSGLLRGRWSEAVLLQNTVTLPHGHQGAGQSAGAFNARGNRRGSFRRSAQCRGWHNRMLDCSSW